MASLRRKRVSTHTEPEDQDRKLSLVPESRRIDDDSLVDHSETSFGDIHVHEDGEEIWLISYADLMTLLVAFFAMLLSFSKIDPSQFEKVKEEATKVFGGEYVIPYAKLSDTMKAVLAAGGLKDQVFVEQTPEGIVLDFKGSFLFTSGSVVLRSEAQGLLSKVIPVVISQAKGFKVVIEGHTDDEKISEGLIKSNWELSGLRASSVARMFLANDFPEKFLRIEGYGETVPKIDYRKLTGEALINARSINRRVVIRILKQY